MEKVSSAMDNLASMTGPSTSGWETLMYIIG